MTKLNVVNEAIEFLFPRKQKRGIRLQYVFHLIKAKEILERYKEHKGKLLPFISEQKYNDAIKKIFKKVKDPNLVSALSGHKEGSKAFRRYRDIDHGHFI